MSAFQEVSSEGELAIEGEGVNSGVVRSGRFSGGGTCLTEGEGQ